MAAAYRPPFAPVSNADDLVLASGADSRDALLSDLLERVEQLERLVLRRATDGDMRKEERARAAEGL